MSNEDKDLNNIGTTIQLQVDKMERDTARQASKAQSNSKQRNRSSQFSPAMRPSKGRGTDVVTGPCKVCGASSWDTDDIRGETTCSECGFVAAENMIDPGAEWINHSDGDDRSRVGAPSTLTLSDTVSYTHLTLPTTPYV